MYSRILLAALLGAPAAAEPPAPYPTPDRPHAVQPARGWDVQHLHLAVDIDLDAGSLSGRTVHRLAPLARTARRVRFHQVGLTFDGVLVDGQETTFEVYGDWIEIPVSPGEAHEVTIDYRAEPQLGMHFRRPGQDSSTYREVWTQGENEDHRHWFPSWDHPSDRFTLSTDVTVEDGLTALANGTLTGRAPAADGKTTWSYRLDHRVVNYLVVVAAGEYQELPHDGARVPVSSFIGAELPVAVAEGLDTAVPMLPWFDTALGTPYPFDQYRQITVQSFMYGGMENSSTTVLADGLLVKKPWDDPRAAEAVVAHELAHQWFGDLLTCYGWRELWLNEGFATYWTNRWMEHAYPPEYVATRWSRHLNSARRQGHPMALRAWAARDGDGENHNVYNRGASVLRMLEGHLGREVFDAGIRHYVATYADSLVETSDLRRALEDVSGEHLGWLFDQWVYRPGSPKVKVKHSYHPPEGEVPGMTEITLEQVAEGTPWFFPVTIEIGTEQEPIRRTIWMDQPVSKLQIQTPQAPAWVMADPDQTVIARWTQEQDREQWLTAMDRAPAWETRLAALSHLSNLDEGSQASFLAAAAAWVRDPNLDRAARVRAAEALGRRVSPESTQILLDLASVEPARVRAAAIAALGEQIGQDPRQRLTEAARRDPAAQVRAAALTALQKAYPEQALSLARGATRDEDRVRESALRVLGRLGETKDLKRILPLLSEGEPRGVRRAALSAAWILADRHHDETKLASRAARSIEPMLSSADVRMRSQAIQALAGIGDEESVRHLKAYAASTLIPDHRERALDAARDIRSDKHPPAEAPPDTDDLERMQERIEAIQRRLDELEKRP